MRLDDWILPPPMPAVMGVLISAGLGALGARLAAVGRKDRVPRLEAAAGFIAVTAAVAALVHGLALAGLAHPATLRSGGWALAAVGAVELARHGRGWWAGLQASFAETWRGVGWTGRCGQLVATATVASLGLAALGPPTDSDSLAYHLTVPMDWLAHGGLHVQEGWFHSRLFGLGEALNMLGLAAGTDGLGACLQLAGLVVAVVAMASFAASAPARVLAALLVASAPVMLFLVPSQKPQLLPAAAVFTALALLVQRRQALDGRTSWLAATAIAFAAACKYNFLLTGAVVGAAGLALAVKRGRPGRWLLALACAGVVLVGPVWGRNVAVYGDPLTPNLEAWRQAPDPAVVGFAGWLRSCGLEPGPTGRLAGVGQAVITLRPGHLSTVLGVGAVAFLLALPAAGAAGWLLACAAAAAALVVLLGQVSGRFLLEPYLWAAAAAVVSGRAAPAGRWRTFAALLTLQGALVLLMALVGAARLFPGAWSREGRDRVMTSSAEGYAEGKWMARALPGQATILSQSRTVQAFEPRVSVVYDGADFVPEPQQVAWLCRVVERSGVTALVAEEPASSPSLAFLLREAPPLTGARDFQLATRNPWNAGAGYRVRAHDVSRSCGAVAGEGRR